MLNKNRFLRIIAGLILMMAVVGQASADVVYSSYKGSQQGVTIRDVNTLNQFVYFNTGVNASGISVDANNNVYLAAGNHLYKYNLSGTRIVDMTFPDARINYTDVAVTSNRVYAAYTGSQQGVTIRDMNTLGQLSFFNTGTNANGIAVDAGNNIYLAAGNHLYKYNVSGTRLVDMTFPDARINYTSVAVSGNRVYAAYTGSQQGVTIRDANTLNQFTSFNTGINASGITLDASNNIYLSAGNHLYKYSVSGTRILDMTFPINSIDYTGIYLR